ncbi:rodlin [Streptomyces sclerotialus]|uniref:rodlin n=1 Tax=Streptomyces sclerotialus TaxID=1957 RepID=UPI0004CB7EA5
MFKKILATGAVAASIIGMAAASAPQALAIGDDEGPTSMTGNGSSSAYGNQTTHGHMSPQDGLTQGTLNDMCLLNFYKIPIALVDDIPILSDQQNMQCAENSSQDKQDQSLADVLENVPILSANGTGNG